MTATCWYQRHAPLPGISLLAGAAPSIILRTGVIPPLPAWWDINHGTGSGTFIKDKLSSSLVSGIFIGKALIIATSKISWRDSFNKS